MLEICQACGQEIKPKITWERKVIREKYWNQIIKELKRHENKNNYKGYIYDSKLESKFAQELDAQIDCGEIIKWERQYKISIYINNIHICNHKVDFLAEHPDGSKCLFEVKGIKSPDYIIRRNLLEAVWLPEHPDVEYVVVR